VLERCRSEADRRRAYVRLVPAALPGPLDTAAAFERAFTEIEQRVDLLAGAMEASAAGRRHDGHVQADLGPKQRVAELDVPVAG
jgi:hypothetical protein